MTLKVQAIRKWIDKKTSGLDKGRVAYTTFLTCSMMPVLSGSAFAAEPDDTIWQKARRYHERHLHTDPRRINHRRHRDSKHCAAADEFF